MKITKSHEYTVNMGDFESKKTGAAIEADLEELGLSFEEALAELDRKLDVILADDLAKLSDLTHKKDSFVHSYVGGK
jgi:hypothetical protein